jgi:putative transport protein
METIGLNVFIAVVGIGAGPHAVEAMKHFGLQLFLAGVVVSVVPHMALLLVGRYILKMNLGVLLGASAGAGTTTPSLQAVVEEARSSVPVFGFTVPYAISNVLLTAWGPVVVALV